MPSTIRSKNVSILNESFFFPLSGRHRRIWAYLPGGYHTSAESYPVIYMQDGQDLFNETTGAGSRWGVDEILDIEKAKVIVIGIEHAGEHRLSEYSMHDHPEYGEAEGAAYMVDISKTLKPYVDMMLRTLPGREHTCIAGGEGGGLISLYAGLYLDNIFGTVAIFSPTLSLDTPLVFDKTREILGRNPVLARVIDPQRWYVYAGAMESETMFEEVTMLVEIMLESPLVDVTCQLDSSGIQKKTIWKDYFFNFYKWFIAKKPAEAQDEESDAKIA